MYISLGELFSIVWPEGELIEAKAWNNVALHREQVRPGHYVRWYDVDDQPSWPAVRKAEVLQDLAHDVHDRIGPHSVMEIWDTLVCGGTAARRLGILDLDTASPGVYIQLDSSSHAVQVSANDLWDIFTAMTSEVPSELE